MRISLIVLLGLLAVHTQSFGQELKPRQTFTGWFADPSATAVPTSARSDGRPNAKSDIANSQPVATASFLDSGSCASDSHGCTASCGTNCGGLHWSHDCFPRGGCPDDYCPNPFPRQCWPPYPVFYRCVPAGDCAGCRQRSDDLSWWFIPKPRTLRDAVGWRP
jgi:hypothetical protein